VTVAIQLDNRDEVNKVVDAAIAAGGTEEGETMDDEIIYSRGVCDLDGHRLDINCLKTQQ
jgi:predicted lactoylglutathione lyase